MPNSGAILLRFTRWSKIATSLTFHPGELKIIVTSIQIQVGTHFCQYYTYYLDIPILASHQAWCELQKRNSFFTFLKGTKFLPKNHGIILDKSMLHCLLEWKKIIFNISDIASNGAIHYKATGNNNTFLLKNVVLLLLRLVKSKKRQSGQGRESYYHPVRPLISPASKGSLTSTKNFCALNTNMSHVWSLSFAYSMKIAFFRYFMLMEKNSRLGKNCKLVAWIVIL